MAELIAYAVDATSRVIDLILYMSGAIILIVVIWGAIQYIQGNAEDGKKTITAAVIGAVIISLAAIIINTVNHLINN